MPYQKTSSLGAFLLFSLPAYAGNITLLNWEEYLSPEVEQRWEALSGLKIDNVYFDNDEKRDAILLNAQHHKIDLAVVDEIVADRFGKEGRLLEITEAQVPNLKHIGEFWRQRCGNYAIPYFWGTLGIVYRTDKVSPPPTSWRDLLQPQEQHKGHIGMLDDYTDMLAPALFFSGHRLNTENKQELKDAFDILQQQAPDVLTYEYAITYVSSTPDPEQLHMALAYGGDQYALNDRSGQENLWKYSIPQEGTVLWVDCLAISSQSENIDAALSFINYLADPHVAAKNAEEMYFATPNTSALEVASEEYRNDPEIFPPDSVVNRSDLYTELSNGNVEQRLRITNAVRNIHETRKAR